jgi:hypothetical protein
MESEYFLTIKGLLEKYILQNALLEKCLAIETLSKDEVTLSSRFKPNLLPIIEAELTLEPYSPLHIYGLYALRLKLENDIELETAFVFTRLSLQGYLRASDEPVGTMIPRLEIRFTAPLKRLVEYIVQYTSREYWDTLHTKVRDAILQRGYPFFKWEFSEKTE